MKNEMRIGIFDSGIGGLTVLSECIKGTAGVSYYYYGDNRNAPYGARGRSEITRFVKTAMEKFAEIGVSAAVLACNTATAVCAEQMRNAFSFPVIGMEPAVKPAAEICKHALVLATPRTAESERLQSLLSRFPQCHFTVFPAAKLAGAIEATLTTGAPFDLTEHLPQGRFDGVVLGCTHYIYFRREISDFYGVPVFDGNAGTANRLLSLLDRSFCGRDDHLTPQNTNVCLFQNLNGITRNNVYFVGKDGGINKKVYKSEQMFQFQAKKIFIF